MGSLQLAGKAADKAVAMTDRSVEAIEPLRPFMTYLLLAAVRAPPATAGALSCAADSEDTAGHPAP